MPSYGLRGSYVRRGGRRSGLLLPWNEKSGRVGMSLLIAQPGSAFADFFLLGPAFGSRPVSPCGHSEKLDSEVILLDVDTGLPLHPPTEN